MNCSLKHPQIYSSHIFDIESLSQNASDMPKVANISGLCTEMIYIIKWGISFFYLRSIIYTIVSLMKLGDRLSKMFQFIAFYTAEYQVNTVM